MSIGRNIHQELNAYVVKMEQLAAIGQVRDNPNHPLLGTINTLRQLLNSYVSPEGLLIYQKLGTTPQEVISGLFNLLKAQSHYGYDRMYWLSDAYFDELSQDYNTLTFIQQRLPHPEHYDSTIAELAYWGWLKARGLSPKLTEELGKPDLLIGLDTEGDSIYCDVKAILNNTDPRRIRKIISKANNQIKNVAGEESKGFCFIRVTKPVIRTPSISETNHGFLDLVSEEADRNTASVPNEIIHYYTEAQRVMSSNSSKSVAKVILCWEEQMIRGNFPGWLTVVGNLRSCEIDHINARRTFHIATDLLPKATIAFNINLKPRVATLNFHRLY